LEKNILKIAIFGLGYVGCVSAACFASEGHQIIGVDINEDKVEIINSGRSPIVEPGLDDKIHTAVKCNLLKASSDFYQAVKNSDISLICVGTPSQKNGAVLLDFIFKVAEEIGKAISQTDRYHVFVIRSTVPPGTLESSLKIIGEISGKQVGKDFGGCSNPEFLREGSALKDFYAPPYTVIGEYDERSGSTLAHLYKSIDAPLIRTEVRVSEMVKYANNVFHAVKVAFGNEMGTICKNYGVDSHKLMEIFCMDDKLNLSSYYLKPGFSFGGSCLPKDVRALAYQAKSMDLDLPLIRSLMSSNQEHTHRAVDMVLSYGKKSIGILGLSFKGNTDDLRESPMVDVVETLIGKGYEIRIYDRNVQLAKLFGANKEYINQRIPHISNLMVDDVKDLIKNSELIIIGNKNEEFVDVLKQLNGSELVLDFVRIFKDIENINSNYEGICW
jgi:GDP-mannose 6-dehydrogenase